MTDIVERLRQYPAIANAYPAVKEAADVIERLRTALKPLAELPVGAELFTELEYDEHGTNSLDTVLYKNGGNAISARDVLNAREALNQQNETPQTIDEWRKDRTESGSEA